MDPQVDGDDCQSRFRSTIDGVPWGKDVDPDKSYYVGPYIGALEAPVSSSLEIAAGMYYGDPGGPHTEEGLYLRLVGTPRAQVGRYVIDGHDIRARWERDEPGSELDVLIVAASGEITITSRTELEDSACLEGTFTFESATGQRVTGGQFTVTVLYPSEE